MAYFDKNKLRVFRIEAGEYIHSTNTYFTIAYDIQEAQDLLTKAMYGAMDIISAEYIGDVYSISQRTDK